MPTQRSTLSSYDLKTLTADTEAKTMTLDDVVETADYAAIEDAYSCRRRTRTLQVPRCGHRRPSTGNDIRRAFAVVDMPRYRPHDFRKTLARYGDEVCATMEGLKVWSMTLGHEPLATSVNAFIPVSPERQRVAGRSG